MDRKELIVVSGPNGAGKTTFAKLFLSRHSSTYLSADAIAAELSPNDPTSAQLKAGREFLIRCQHHLAEATSLLMESTLSGRGLRHFLVSARDAGFQITLYHVFLDHADLCVARVQERVRKGGHDVPVPDIRRRFVRSAQNFWNIYRRLADQWVLVYNATVEFNEVAVGSVDTVSIQDEALFQIFLKQTEGI